MKWTSNRIIWLCVIIFFAGLLTYAFLPFPRYPMEYDEVKVNFKTKFLSETKTAKKGKPNIILILADDLGKTDISLYGSPFVKTKNIDAIGKEGATCMEGYVTAPICSPSRAGLLTGRYQQRFGHELQPGERYLRNRLEYFVIRNFWGIGELVPNDDFEYPYREDIENQGLPLSEITIAELLKANGYKTAITGKWHLGHEENFKPNNRGFEYQYGFYASHSLYNDTTDENYVNYRNPEFIDKMMWVSGREGTHAIYRNDELIEEKEYLTDKIAEEANLFIEKNKDNPFFLYIPFNAPHTPLQAPAEYYNQFAHIEDPAKRTYYAMIMALDDAVGKITKKVKDLGLEENTMIVFISDNGGATYTHTTENLPLKGGKFTNFEGGLNIPFMLKWKGKIPANTVYKKPVITMDIFATIAELAGVKLPEDREYDGINLLPYLTVKKEETPHQTLFWRSGYNKAVRKGNWKLIIDTENNKTILYDISEDKNEKKNLSGQNPDKVAELKKDLEEWEKKMRKPLWPHIMSYHFLIEGEDYYFAL